MKTRLLFASLALAVLFASGVRAEGTQPAPATPPAAKHEKPETELEQTMGKMSKDWRQVRKAAKDGKLSPALAPVVASVRKNAVAAAKLTPQLEGEKPAGDRAKFHTDYLAQLKKLDAKLAELEAALTANDMAKAGKLVGDVGDIVKSGHHEFKKPDEHEKEHGKH
jgi:hypothetical protein